MVGPAVGGVIVPLGSLPIGSVPIVPVVVAEPLGDIVLPFIVPVVEPLALPRVRLLRERVVVRSRPLVADVAVGLGDCGPVCIPVLPVLIDPAPLWVPIVEPAVPVPVVCAVAAAGNKNAAVVIMIIERMIVSPADLKVFNRLTLCVVP